MADSIDINGYWGPITSSTSCEHHYAVSGYVAEFYNTFSNVPGILLAIIVLVNSMRQRFEKRFSSLNLATILVGLGSMLYHGTLQHMHQQSEETPMVWLMLMYFYVLYSPDWHYRSTMPTVLFIYGSVFAVVHSQLRFILSYQVHYFFLGLLCLPRMYKYYIHTTDRHAKWLAHMYVLTTVMGCTCWIVDWAFCDRITTWPINPHLHAWWHLFNGLDDFFANTYLQFCRAQQLNWSPQLHYMFGLPYVKVTKPKVE